MTDTLFKENAEDLLERVDLSKLAVFGRCLSCNKKFKCERNYKGDYNLDFCPSCYQRSDNADYPFIVIKKKNEQNSEGTGK